MKNAIIKINSYWHWWIGYFKDSYSNIQLYIEDEKSYFYLDYDILFHIAYSFNLTFHIFRLLQHHLAGTYFKTVKERSIDDLINSNHQIIIDIYQLLNKWNNSIENNEQYSIIKIVFVIL